MRLMSKSNAMQESSSPIFPVYTYSQNLHLVFLPACPRPKRHKDAGRFYRFSRQNRLASHVFFPHSRVCRESMHLDQQLKVSHVNVYTPAG